jgi:hypothetical protein
MTPALAADVMAARAGGGRPATGRGSIAATQAGRMTPALAADVSPTLAGRMTPPRPAAVRPSLPNTRQTGALVLRGIFNDEVEDPRFFVYADFHGFKYRSNVRIAAISGDTQLVEMPEKFPILIFFAMEQIP